jgi:hypothetical protein
VHCGRGSAVSTSVVTRCSIVISMREALVFGVVAPAGAKSELSRAIPRSPGGEVHFIPCPI